MRSNATKPVGLHTGGYNKKKAIPPVTIGLLQALVNNFPSVTCRRYYKHVIIEHRNINLNSRAFGVLNTALHLDQIYIDLKVSHSENTKKPKPDPLVPEGLVNSGSIWDFLPTAKDQTGYAIALAVLGPPGYGKTTLLQHVALILATKRHRRYGLRSYIPISLSIRNHVESIIEDHTLTTFSEIESITLGELAQEYFNRRFKDLKASPNWFERNLKSGKCFVLLDGLDEVAEIEKRELISRWIDQQIRNYPKCYFVITSRPSGYKAAPLQQARVLEVQPLSTQKVNGFIKSWYLANTIIWANGEKDAEVQRRARVSADDLLQQLSTFPALSELTINPLLLTMIAMVHSNCGRLPDTRVELYDRIFEVLLERWRQSKGIKEKLSAPQKKLALMPLAAEMTKNRTQEITTDEAIPLIKPPLLHVGLRADEIDQFLEDIEESSGLLLRHKTGWWSFAHRSFQEYLAANHWLVKKDIRLNWSELIADDWWHETLIFYAARGDASPLLCACLEANTAPALTLASECLDEASNFSADVGQAIEDRVTLALESSDIPLFCLAAKVRLSRRLKSLHRIDDCREIDLKHLTCAEYQLFLEDMREEGKYFQPDHWEFCRFPKGDAVKPVTGMRASDAEAFCQWLTQQAPESGFIYRLPSLTEVEENQAVEKQIGCWCSDELNKIVAGVDGSQWKIWEEGIGKVFDRYFSKDLVSAIEGDLLLDGVKDQSVSRQGPAGRPTKDQASAYIEIRNYAHNLGFDIDRNYNLNISSVPVPKLNLPRLRHNFDLSIARDITVNERLIISSAFAAPTTRGQGSIPKHDLTKEFAFNIEHALNRDPSRAQTRKLTFDRARFFLLLSCVILSSLLKKRDGVFDYALDVYQFMVLLCERRKSRMPAWEGIRIVRERINTEYS